MKSFAYMCKIYQADKTIAVATAAIRNAANGAELVARVAEETGIQLHIISGNTEAYISYLGVINTLNVRDGIIFDLGGGSTELILFKNRKILESVSLPIGESIPPPCSIPVTSCPPMSSAMSAFLS